MIFGIFAVRSAHETPDGEIDSRRTVLSLVVAVRDKVATFRFVAARAEDVLDGAIDVCVPATASFVGERAWVADARQHESMANPLQAGFVPRQPRNRSD